LEKEIVDVLRSEALRDGLEGGASLSATLAALAGIEWLMTPADQKIMLQRAARAARESTGVDMVFGGIASGSGVQLSTLDGARTDSLLSVEVRPGRGLGGQAVSGRRPTRSVDYESDASITDDYRTWVAPEHLRGVVAVPVLASTGVRGLLYAGNRAPTNFGDDILDDLVIAAQQLAVAMTVAKRAERDIELAVAEERRRVAIALHDSVGALLFTIRASIHDLEQQLSVDQDLAARLADLENYAGEAADALRDSLRALHDTASEVVVGTTLHSDARHFEHRSGIRAHVVLTSKLPALPPVSADALISAVREGLLNVEKHARASSVIITAFASTEDVIVLVADDGAGLQHRDEQPRGIGLASSRERLARLGGELELSDNADCGTIMRARVPR